MKDPLAALVMDRISAAGIPLPAQLAPDVVHVIAQHVAPHLLTRIDTLERDNASLRARALTAELSARNLTISHAGCRDVLLVLKLRSDLERAEERADRLAQQVAWLQQTERKLHRERRRALA